MIDTKRPKWVIAGAVALIAGLLALPAIAELGEPVTDTQTDGVTTVTWDSSFEDPDYTLGAILEVTVTWTVDAGLAEYDSFVQRFPNFTPKGPDPANGSGFEVTGEPAPGTAGDGSVTFAFQFDELHCDEENDVEVGNAHFSLILDVDTDGDEATDSEVAYGVNVHVEQPGECTSDGDDDNGGPPPGVPPTGNDSGAQGDDTEVLENEVDGDGEDDEELDGEGLDAAIAELSEDIPGDADDVRANVVTMLEFIAGNGDGDDEEIDSAPGAFGKGVAALANQISDEDDDEDEEEEEEDEEEEEEEEEDSEAQGGVPAGTPAGRP